jgi:hypothetical protein
MVGTSGQNPSPQVAAPQGTVLQRYANARILLFANQVPGVLESPRIGRFLFEAFVKRLRQISSKENSPGVDTGDFTYEGYLTRGALLPLQSCDPWDWLDAVIPWTTTGLRPFMSDGSTLLTPCSGAIWLGDLSHLQSPGALPPLNRAQFAGFSVLEFGGLYGAGGIGSRTQPLLGERIEASLKPNRVVVIVPGDTLVVLAERHGTSVAVLRSLNPDLLIDAAAPLPVGSWLFIPRRRTTTTGTTAISSAAAAAVVLYTPETLAAHLGVTLATLENWRLSSYGPAWFQLGELIRYSATDVDSWLALQFEQAQG